MSEPTLLNLQAFKPYGGGQGVRLAVSSSSTSGQIPGLGGGQQNDRTRVMVSNSGSVAGCVLMGVAGVQANTACFEILPGDQWVLTPPFIGTSNIYIAAITESGTTTIKACAGEGT